MQYINVSQFYESILCFSIPLLIIQRVLLCCCDLSTRYEDYRLMFYEQEFRFTKEYEHAVEEPAKEMPAEGTVRDQMIQKQEGRDENEDGGKVDKGIDIDVEHDQEQENRERIISFSSQMNQPSINGSTKQKSLTKTNSVDIRPKNKIGIDLETDRQLRNSSSLPSINRQQLDKQHPMMKKKSTQGKQEIQESQSDHPSIDKKIGQAPQNSEAPPKKAEGENIKVQEIQESRMSHATDLQVRRQTQLDDEMQHSQKKEQQHQQTKGKQIIELGTGALLLKGEQDKTKLKYCRRVDDAFNDYVPIIMSVVVLGILTQSVYILSMCCFFGYAFSSLLFNYVHLLDLIEGSSKETFFGKANQLISSLFIIGLFISYWVSTQFY